MRALASILLLALASCGDGAAENKAAVAAAPSRGQWELSAQVTRFTRTDQGTPRINTPVGTRTTQSVCVASGGRLPAALFSGDDLTCNYDSYYVRNGNANATLTCQRHGLTGTIMVAADGTFGADRIDLRRNVRTVLTTDGDVQIDAEVTGRRTGPCTPAPPSEGANRQ